MSRVPWRVHTRAVTTELGLAAAAARVAPVSAVDTVVARGAGTRVGSGQILTRGAILTSEVRNIVKPSVTAGQKTHSRLEMMQNVVTRDVILYPAPS